MIKVLKMALREMFFDHRYCRDPSTTLKPLSFLEHIRRSRKRLATMERERERWKMVVEERAKLSDADRAYGISVDSHGIRSEKLGLGS